MKNIALVGFMGTGKTTVAGLIVEQLPGMKLIAADDMIEKKAKMAIKEIFAKKGEGYFRGIEREVIKEVSKMRNSVIDAGGGAVINKLNARDLKTNGVIFCLNAAPEAILKRIEGHSHRPLLNVADPLSQINKLLEKRSIYYQRADYQVDTTAKSAKEVAREIVAIYNHVRPN